jgi:uncharacterized membrane protein
MADDGRQTLVGISFDDTYRAQEFLTAATRLASLGRLKLKDAVMVLKDADGQTRVRETIDPQPGRAALSGALWAGVFGLLLGGPVGWIAGAAIGAGAGAVTAKVVDVGIPDEWVHWFRESVESGTSTLALLIEDVQPQALVDELERFEGARLVYANLDPLWVERMREALGEPNPEAEPAAEGVTAPAGESGPPPHGAGDIDGPGAG